ncbi:unnamed protein product [Nippostrongylus brasiliensis]|uniref:UAE_UbL domain-containing protein n=1 Tax=Nippostrongylus brasiliensis TaxID=27835 RepID=A0A0N4Y0G8_NIPBR|nr:unnamed protein product [Nippostrongylus brasiliensis]
MLGMMNSPADGVEFYATNESLRNGISAEDLKTFTEDVESGGVMALWGNVLLRGAVRTHMNVEALTEGKKEKKEKKQSQSDEEEANEEQTKPVYIQIISPCRLPIMSYARRSILGAVVVVQLAGVKSIRRSGIDR